MVVDYDGRILAQASPGPGERIVVAPINIDMLRHERRSRRAHQMLAHLRTECFPMYQQRFYPPGRLTRKDNVTVSDLERQIDAVKQELKYLAPGEPSPLYNLQSLLYPPT